MPGARPVPRTERTASSLGSGLKSFLWYLSAMWRIALTTKTATAESTTGSHRDPNGIGHLLGMRRAPDVRRATIAGDSTTRGGFSPRGPMLHPCALFTGWRDRLLPPLR